MANVFGSISKILEALLEELKEREQVEYYLNDYQMIRLTMDQLGTFKIERLEKRAGQFEVEDEETWYTVDGLIEFLTDVFRRELQKKLAVLLLDSVSDE